MIVKRKNPSLRRHCEIRRPTVSPGDVTLAASPDALETSEDRTTPTHVAGSAPPAVTSSSAQGVALISAMQVSISACVLTTEALQLPEQHAATPDWTHTPTSLAGNTWHVVPSRLQTTCRTCVHCEPRLGPPSPPQPTDPQAASASARIRTMAFTDVSVLRNRSHRAQTIAGVRGNQPPTRERTGRGAGRRACRTRIPRRPARPPGGAIAPGRGA
jgi:hypothetical protein